MPGQQVTNAREDPNWWAAQLSNPNPNVRHTAEANIERIYRNRSMGQNESQFQRQMAMHNLSLQEGIRDRQERARQAIQQRRFDAYRDDMYRKALMDQRAAAQKSEDEARMFALLPDIEQKFGKQGQQIAKEMLARYLAQHGQNVNVQPQQTPADQAIARAGQAEGKTPVGGQATGTAPAAGGGQAPAVPGQPQVQTGAGGGSPNYSPSEFYQEPVEAPTRVGYHWIKGTGGVSGGNDAGQVVFWSDGSQTWEPTSVPGQPPPTLPNVRRNVEGGQINPEFARERGIPEGYDFNFNTGRLVPQGYEGTINGKPSSQAVAESAARTGKPPVYSDKARALFDAAKGETEATMNAGAGRPTLPVGPTGQPDVGQTMPYLGKPMGPDIYSPAALAEKPQAPQPPPIVERGSAPAPAQTGEPTPYGPNNLPPANRIWNAGAGALDWLGENVFKGAREAEARRKPPPPPPIVEEKETEKKKES